MTIHFVFIERGLRVKAERHAQAMVQVVAPNGGESFYLGAMNTVSWSGMGLAGAVLKLELLVNGEVAGIIAENLPGTQTSYEWQAGKMLSGWASPGSDLKVRVTAVVPPAADGTTYYFYDSGGKLLAEYDGSGACVKDYLYLGGNMIGEYVPTTSSYYYYASDQINSTRLVTDATGAVVHSAQYDPYGGLYKTWIDTYHPKPGFSGKEREFGSDLDYFGARYYGHRQYRFLSVDPVIGKEETITNPQLWNLYAYCGNNPISKFDPDGRKIVVAGSFQSEIQNALNLGKLSASGNALFQKLDIDPRTITLQGGTLPLESNPDGTRSAPCGKLTGYSTNNGYTDSLTFTIDFFNIQNYHSNQTGIETIYHELFQDTLTLTSNQLLKVESLFLELTKPLGDKKDDSNNSGQGGNSKRDSWPIREASKSRSLIVFNKYIQLI